jgi:hypothetical protein
MRKMRRWTLAFALSVGLSASAARADDSDDVKPQPPPPKPFIRWSPWAKKAFGIEDLKPVDKKQAAKKADGKAKNSDSKVDATAKPAKLLDSAAAKRSREEAALLRRLAVCDKLMEIAVQTGDRDLMRRAEELDARARAVYAQRTGLGADATAELDAQKLDRNLDSEAVAARPAQQAMYSVAGNDRNRHAFGQEANP